MWRCCGLIIALSAFVSCSDEDIIQPTDNYRLMEIPEGFPPVIFPEDNEFTIQRWNLGKLLFNDKALSRNNNISCASCHKSELAFSDNVSFSNGTHNSSGKSNAPSLSNIAYHPYFTRAGGVPTLEMQVLVPAQEHDEFDFNLVDLTLKLRKEGQYNAMSQDAYGRIIDAYVITHAIANYERSFISGNSAYDKFRQGNNNALTPEQIRGMYLFFSRKTSCSSCHSAFNFTDYSFANNGLYEIYADSGRMRLTHLESDRALFKVPSLRNVEYTAPYMHDGSFNTLEDVVEHYNSGGENHINKSIHIKPLNLTNTEKRELVEFLKSLSDKEFVTAQIFK
jgi:cytochrome c peroxidase